MLFIEGQQPRGIFVLCIGKAKLSTSSAEGWDSRDRPQRNSRNLNYDGAERSASSNNTVYLLARFVF
jgi:hypothetical protein